MRIPKHHPGFPETCPQTAGGIKHTALLKGLRAEINRIEQSHAPLPKNNASWGHHGHSSSNPAPEPTHKNCESWNFGSNDIDAFLPGNALNISALHEIKPATYQDSHAAIGFAMALAGRRAMADPDGAQLWCLPPLFSSEFGMPYGPGLRRLMPCPENCLITEPGNMAELLWVMEEGVSLGTFGLVLAAIKTIEPTPARRLSLRAGTKNTPALLITHHETPGINMADTRWRIKRAPSQTPPHLSTAPGPARWAVTLERGPLGKEELNWIMEWRHETHSFILAAPLADRTHGPTEARLRSVN